MNLVNDVDGCMDVDGSKNYRLLTYERKILFHIPFRQTRVVEISYNMMSGIDHVSPFFFFNVRMCNLSFFILTEISIYSTNRCIFYGYVDIFFTEFDFSLNRGHVLCTVLLF